MNFPSISPPQPRQGSRLSAMLLNTLLHQVGRGFGGMGKTEDPVTALAKQVRLELDKLRLLKEQQDQQDAPRAHGVKVATDQHNLSMQPKTEVLKQAEVDQIQNNARINQNALYKSDVENNALRSSVVPVSPGSPEMRALRPEEQQTVNTMTAAQTAQTLKNIDTLHRLGFIEWSDTMTPTGGDYNPKLPYGAKIPDPNDPQKFQLNIPIAHLNAAQWFEWAKAAGVDVESLNGKKWNPYAEDKANRLAANENLLQMRQHMEDLLRAGRKDNPVPMGALFGYGTPAEQNQAMLGAILGKMTAAGYEPAVIKQFEDLYNRRSALSNRLGKTTQFLTGDESKLWELPSGTFNKELGNGTSPDTAPKPPTVEPPAPVAPLGMNEISGAFGGVRADHPFAPSPAPPAVPGVLGSDGTLPVAPPASATVNPQGKTLGEMLGIKPDGSAPREVDAARLFDAVGRDAAKARQVGDLLKGLGFSIPGY